jgi:3-hydroxyisobutyrate dehydrogenase
VARRIRRIGFVGLGRMGLPMACRLVDAGYEVRGFDVAESARAAFRHAVCRRPADGATPSGIADTLAEAADGADAVVLRLPDPDVIQTVTVDDGLLSAMRPDALLIDMSSSGPAETDRLAARAGARRIHLVGAPVTGGVRAAADGTLTIMADGSRYAVNRARPLLDALGSRVVHVGDASGLKLRVDRYQRPVREVSVGPLGRRIR